MCCAVANPFLCFKLDAFEENLLEEIHRWNGSGEGWSQTKTHRTRWNVTPQTGKSWDLRKTCSKQKKLYKSSQIFLEGNVLDEGRLHEKGHRNLSRSNLKSSGICRATHLSMRESLWFHRHFCSMATVFPSSLCFHRHCGSIVTAVPSSLWFHRHCGSIVTAVPW